MELATSRADRLGDQSLGTCFWIFPQAPFIPGYGKPERVWLSILPDEISPGPSDLRMYVVDPLFDKEPYGSTSLPPFDGIARPPILPGPDRHFDHLDPFSRSFLGAHAYACVHFVLDIWESYLGHPIRWFFEETFERLEIVPFVNWPNARAGYGFLELGCWAVDDEVPRPFALNFDSVAHETAHFISLSELGMPTGIAADSDFFSYAEAFSDVVSLISFLHFDTALDRLLRRTRGNLLVFNELNRFAETSPETQIRLASNSRRMSDVTQEIHDRSLPFTGAVFDSIVHLYHHKLVERGAASSMLLDIDLRNVPREDWGRLGDVLAPVYEARPLLFKNALAAARDEIARSIADSVRSLDAGTLGLSTAANAIVSAAKGRAAEILVDNFEWRELMP